MRRSTVRDAVAGLVVVLGAAGLSAVDPPSAVAAPTTSGLVLNYRFDSDSGVSARDSSPNAIHGTYVNTTAAAARSAGMPGQSWAITLVGAKHQFVSVPERNALDVDRFTVAALIRYTGVENDKTFGRWEVIEKAGAYWINIRTDGTGPGRWLLRWLHVRGMEVPRQQGRGSHEHLDPRRQHLQRHHADGLDQRRAGGQHGGHRQDLSATTARWRWGPRTTRPGLLEAFWDGQLDDIRIYRRALSADRDPRLLPS